MPTSGSPRWNRSSGAAPVTEEELDDLSKRSEVLAAIADDLRRAKTAIRMLRVGAVVLVLLFFAIGGLALRVQRQASDIRTTKRTLTLVCLAGNDSRAGLNELFHFFLDRPPPPDQTEEQAKELAEAIATVNRILDQRDCTKPFTTT